jgi:hypothetical protein
MRVYARNVFSYAKNVFVSGFSRVFTFPLHNLSRCTHSYKVLSSDEGEHFG